MKTVTKRELNQQTAAVLAGVEAGETLLVTERGVPRWAIEQVGDTSDALARLMRGGRVRPAASVPAPWPVDTPDGYTPEHVDRLFEESRGEH